MLTRTVTHTRYEAHGYKDALGRRPRVLFSYKNPNEVHYTLGYKRGLYTLTRELLVQGELFDVSCTR